MIIKIYEKIKILGIKRALKHLNKDPDKNIPKILAWIEKFDKDSVVERQLRTLRKIIGDNENNWYKLVKSLWTDIDDGVRKRIFENLVINATIVGGPRQDRVKEKSDCNIPWAILMDPTTACNLNCIGCWAAEYDESLNMSFETLDDIINQGKALGVFMYIYSGGEPLVRKKDILKLCEKHSNCLFLSFTNSILIDEQFADDMLRVKNFIPAISVEGFKEETDARRGSGTYKATINAMEILKRKKLLFGISCCYTKNNTEIIGSEKYFDEMIYRGAKFAWFFTYMPVGIGAVSELMATAEQREFMYHQIRGFRQTKSLFTLDFWNDGEYTNGCIAGGRYYLHINANGDIEPCAFIHYSDSNIYKKTLMEALKSPLFMQYYRNQPFNGNHLRPCPLLDNPERLTQMVEASGAKSTDMNNPEYVQELCAKCEKAAKNWAVVADNIWKHANTCPCCSNCTICNDIKTENTFELSKNI